MRLTVFFQILSILMVFQACKRKAEIPSADEKIFVEKDFNHSNILFSNNLTENETINYFTYPYIYMGGGIAVGDINNDGLDDLFFTGNQVKNKLYLNKGKLQFEDITTTAQIGGDDRWYTGVTMADVNGDGYLDIYTSVSGKSGNKKNQLFINNKNLTFSEKAKEYGLDDSGQSVNATFFDYDNDGDLDVYVANYPITPFSTPVDLYKEYMHYAKEATSDHLYRNDNNKFVKVTQESGLMQYNLSLAAVATDINNDGWQDLYVSSDFSSPDFLYLNNKDGTFSNIIDKAVSHTSFYGMGVDIADFNNDAKLDILQMDMDAASNRRSKANMASMNPMLFEDIESAGFKTQYMQNALQIQVGNDKNNIPVFSEISRLAGVSSTDWSWGPLFADFDNDGLKDVFISNGTRREINNKDYFNSLKNKKNVENSLLSKTLKIPSEAIDNYVFKNNGDLTFEKVNQKWGISHKGFSNGAVYADLDNDGDLDMVVNNIDEKASLFENTLDHKKKYISIKFKGSEKNTYALGVKAYLYYNNKQQFQELTLSRGFQSSVAPKLFFGLGKIEKIDSLRIVWPNQMEQVLTNIKTNQELVIELENASKIKGKEQNAQNTLFDSFTKDTLVSHKHTENRYNDFKHEILLPHKTSQFGPGIAVGDLNEDGLDDFYIGGASKYAAGIYFQNKEGGFEQQKMLVLEEDTFFEDLGAHIFDADNDGDNDLYIVSGGNEFKFNSKMLQDRLYVNQGDGKFKKSSTALPIMLTSGSRVYSNDYDKDGDLDLFVCGRLVPGNYPYPADSYLLENISTKGTPKFKDASKKVASSLKKIGLVTTAMWLDYDKDGWTDLFVAGEWMPIKVYKNNKGSFKDVTSKLGLSNTVGWWFSMANGDFDNDGDIDLIAGNLGLNYKYKAKEKETFDIYFNDFDGNNKNDIVLSYYNEGKKYPVRGRECSSQQIPEIKKKFKSYNEFSTATLTELYSEAKLEKGLHYKVKSFASIYLENKGGKFIKHILPNEAQVSPLNQIIVNDFDKDNILDVIAAGNLYASEVETPRVDAGHGIFLKGKGNNGFTPLTATQSGFFASGDVKDMCMIKVKEEKYIITVKNNDFLQFIKCK